MIAPILLILLLTACKGSKLTQSSRTAAPTALAPAADYQQADQLFNEAAVYQAQQNTKEALASYLKVLQLAPRMHAARYFVAQLLLEQGKAAEALPYIQEALKADPNNEWYYLLAAQVFEQNNDLAHSITTLELASARFAGELDLPFRLAEYYLKAGQYASALATYDTLQGRTGMYEEIGLQKRNIYVRLKQPDKAVAELRKLLRLYPDETRFYLLLYETYLYFENYEKGIQVMEELLSIDPNNDVALFKLIDYYTGKNDQANLKRYVERAFSSNGVSLDAKVKYVLGLLPYFADEATHQQAVKLSQQLLQGSPHSPAALALRGEVYGLENRMDSARALLKHSLQLEPVNREGWERLLVADYSLNRYDSLLVDGAEALELFPNQPLFGFLFGVAQYQQKDYRHAMTSLERVVKAGSSDVTLLRDTYQLLGDCYYYLSDYGKSDKAFEESLNLDPSSPTTLNNYAYFLIQRGARLEDAEKMIQRVLTDHPEEASYQDTYGWLLYKRGEYEKAYSWLQKAYQKSSGAEITEHLGDASFKLGKTEEAIALWKEALSKNELNKELEVKVKNGSL